MDDPKLNSIQGQKFNVITTNISAGELLKKHGAFSNKENPIPVAKNSLIISELRKETKDGNLHDDAQSRLDALIVDNEGYIYDLSYFNSIDDSKGLKIQNPNEFDLNSRIRQLSINAADADNYGVVILDGQTLALSKPDDNERRHVQLNYANLCDEAYTTVACNRKLEKDMSGTETVKSTWLNVNVKNLLFGPNDSYNYVDKEKGLIINRQNTPAYIDYDSNRVEHLKFLTASKDHIGCVQIGDNLNMIGNQINGLSLDKYFNYRGKSTSNVMRFDLVNVNGDTVTYSFLSSSGLEDIKNNKKIILSDISLNGAPIQAYTDIDSYGGCYCSYTDYNISNDFYVTTTAGNNGEFYLILSDSTGKPITYKTNDGDKRVFLTKEVNNGRTIYKAFTENLLNQERDYLMARNYQMNAIDLGALDDEDVWFTGVQQKLSYVNSTGGTSSLGTIYQNTMFSLTKNYVEGDSIGDENLLVLNPKIIMGPLKASGTLDITNNIKDEDNNTIFGVSSIPFSSNNNYGVVRPSTSSNGGVQINDGILSLKAATKTTIGGVSVGNGLLVNNFGKVSVAIKEDIGGLQCTSEGLQVNAGEGLEVVNNTLRLKLLSTGGSPISVSPTSGEILISYASASTAGVVKINSDDCIGIDNGNQLKLNYNENNFSINSGKLTLKPTSANYLGGVIINGYGLKSDTSGWVKVYVAENSGLKYDTNTNDVVVFLKPNGGLKKDSSGISIDFEEIITQKQLKIDNNKISIDFDSIVNIDKYLNIEEGIDGSKKIAVDIDRLKYDLKPFIENIVDSRLNMNNAEISFS